MKKTEDLKSELKEWPIEDFLAKNKGEIGNIALSSYLQTLLAEKKLVLSQVVADSGLEGYGYQIINGTKTNPGRNILLCLIFAMGVNREEADRILKIANVGVLYEKNLRDCCIIKAIEDGYSLSETDDLLEKNGQPTIREG